MSTWWKGLWASNSNADDPLGKLDPELRKYLERESPVKYSSQQQAAQRPRHAKAEAVARAEAAAEEQKKPIVPKESQFQDGRYAELWKSYRPLAEIEAETKSDQEKIMDVLEAFKERKEQVGKAALENCALEQADWKECMTNPNFTERITLCRTQMKKFEKCYTMQTRLLKTLGYLSTYNRTPEQEEEIQMHADKLYHQLVSQEAEIAAARAEGRPIPKFAPILSANKHPTPSTASLSDNQELTPEQQATLQERLKKVSDEERQAEEAAYRAELRNRAEMSSQVNAILGKQDMERKLRKQRGEETTWDKFIGAFRSGNEKS